MKFNLAMSNHRLSFSGLLLLTLAFLIITVLTQWSLILDDSSSHIKQYSLNKINKIVLNSSKCSHILQYGLELKDLQRMKYSYLNELKKLEIKRKNQLKHINQLEQRINEYKLQIDKLAKKHLNLNLKIVSDISKVNSLNVKSQQQFNLIEAINISSHDFSQSVLKIDHIKSECSIDKCFNYKNCNLNQKLKLYIFNSSLLNESLNLEQVKQSFNLVTNQQEACLVAVFLIDYNKDYYQILKEFMAKNNDLNYVLIDSTTNFNLSLDFVTKQLARSVYGSFNIHSNLDYNNLFVHFSVFLSRDYFDQLETIQFNSIKRKYLLSYYGTSSSISTFQLLTKLSTKQSWVNMNLRCSNLCYATSTRLNYLLQSTFTLIIQTEPDKLWSLENNFRLIESLKCGTIPVIIELDLKLPLENLIAWDEIIIKIPLSRINSMLPILISINQNDIAARQIKALNIFNSYFATQTSLFKTLIAAVQFNLKLPLSAIDSLIGDEVTSFNSTELADDPYIDEDIEYETEFLGQINQKPEPSLQYAYNFTSNSYLLWNKYYYPFSLFPSLPMVSNTVIINDFNSSLIDNSDFIKYTNYTIGGYDGRYFHHMLGSSHVEEQFTIVILTFNREKNLINLVDKYVKLPYLNSILIIWNSVTTEPSKEFQLKFKFYLSSKRIRIIKSVLNSLNNRFLPYEHIKTDAVLSLDDDTSLRADEILFAFRVWRTNREQIVGFPARYHTWNQSLNNYVYQSELSCEYSMILTGAAFYHRFYHYYYSFVMTDKIKLKINEIKNCEDIAFNMMVSHLTRKPPIKVTTKFSFRCADCDNNDVPISLKKDHYDKRTECIQYFSSIYNYNPLLYSQFRADSVLYKTKLNDDKKKCFKLI